MRAWMLLATLAGCTGEAPAETDTDTDPGTGEALQEFRPERADFEGVAVGEEASMDITVSNVGDGPLDVLEIALDDDDAPFTVGALGQAQRVRPGGAASFVVTFSPDGPGLHESTVSVATSLTQDPPFRFSVTGTGLVPGLTVAPDAVTLSTADMPARVPVVLTNPGEAELVIDAITVEGSPGFGVDLDPDTNGRLPLALAPVDPETGRPSRTVYVTWDPAAAEGDDTATLRITSSAWAAETVTVPLSAPSR